MNIHNTQQSTIVQTLLKGTSKEIVVHEVQCLMELSQIYLAGSWNICLHMQVSFELFFFILKVRKPLLQSLYIDISMLYLLPTIQYSQLKTYSLSVIVKAVTSLLWTLYTPEVTPKIADIMAGLK